MQNEAKNMVRNASLFSGSRAEDRRVGAGFAMGTPNKRHYKLGFFKLGLYFADSSPAR
jgi:hypothetical protein